MVAAEVTYNNAWYTIGGVLSRKETTSKTYTPFGEQQVLSVEITIEVPAGQSSVGISEIRILGK